MGQQYWAAYKRILMAEGLPTTEQTTQTQLRTLQENKAMDTQRLLKTKIMIYAALWNIRCLKSEFP